MTEAAKPEHNNMHIATYLGLLFLAWILGLVAANIVSQAMGLLYAEATFPVIIGFWLGKLALKNKRRDWVAVIVFPFIALVSTILGFVLGQAIATISQLDAGPAAGLSTIALAFAFASALFGLQNSRATN